MPTLQAAINDVEQASTVLSNTTANDDAAEQKLEAAQATKNQTGTDKSSAVSTFNSSLDALIAAATAAKINPPDPAAPPASTAITAVG